jgi:4-diphosphocytidyl-2-C-methyl-D-erythritol kinase
VTGAAWQPNAEGRAGAGLLRDVARAKVNLTLEIRGRRPDGYHELESLVAFTSFGDVLALDRAQPLSLQVEGPFARTIEGENLIEKAARLYGVLSSDGAREHRPSVDAPRAGEGPHPASSAAQGAFILDKQIPVAAGLGGGSADAAAALRLLEGLPEDTRRLSALLPLAAELGADVPVCLFSKAAIMTGIGERLRFLPAFPRLPILLVNPRLPLSTAAVFRELRAGPLSAVSAEQPDPPALGGIDDVIAYAARRRNDLEAPACRLAPVIAAIIERLLVCPGALLARLSGSGPTCFALFRTDREAEDAAAALGTEQPGWWVHAAALR